MGAKPALAAFTSDGACNVHTTSGTANAYTDNELRFYCLVGTTNGNAAVRMRFGTDSLLVGATTTIFGPTGSAHDFDLWGLSQATTYYYRFEDYSANTTTIQSFTVGVVPDEIIDLTSPGAIGMSWEVAVDLGSATAEYIAYDHAVCDSGGDEDYLLILKVNPGASPPLEVVWYEKHFGTGYAADDIQAFDAYYDEAGNPRFEIISGDRAHVKTVQMDGKVLGRLDYSTTCSGADDTDGPCMHHVVFPSTVLGERRWFIARARAKRATLAYPYRTGLGFQNPEGCGTGVSGTGNCDTGGAETYFAVDSIEVRKLNPTTLGWEHELSWELDQDLELDPDECNGGDLGPRLLDIDYPLKCGAFWGSLFQDAAGDQVYDYSHVNSAWHDGGMYVYLTSPMYPAIAKYQVYDSAGAPITPVLESVLNAKDDAWSYAAFYPNATSQFPYDLGHHLVGLDGETGSKFTIFDNYGNKCFSRGIEIEIGDWDTGDTDPEWRVNEVWEMDLSGYGLAACAYAAATGEPVIPGTDIGQNCMTHGSVYEVDPAGNVVLSCGLVDNPDRPGDDVQGAIMEFQRGEAEPVLSFSPLCDNLATHNPYRAIPLHFVLGGSPRFWTL